MLVMWEGVHPESEMTGYEMKGANPGDSLPRRDAAAVSIPILFVSFVVAACAPVPQAEGGASATANARPQPVSSATPDVQPQPVAGSSAGSSVLDGVFTRSQASRGERIFRQVCAACHAINEFTGGRFRVRWAGRTAGEMFDFVSTTMPEGNPGSLDPEQYADVLAHILSENGYPSGDDELPADGSALRDVRIEDAPAL